MATKTTVTLIDDLDGSEAAETVQFGLDRVSYEIDLSAQRATGLRNALSDYIEHARRSARTTGRGKRGAGKRGAMTRASAATSPADREQNTAIRQWARREGWTLSDRGRIPAAVLEAWHRAPTSNPHPTSTTASATATGAAASTDTTRGVNGGSSAGDGRVGPDGLSDTERELIRSWAQEQGIQVGSRGRLSKDLIGNYRSNAAG